MKKIFALILILLAALPAAVHADELEEVPAPLAGKVKKRVIKELTAGYSDWTTAEVSGKITSLKLMVKPSLKIFMRKGETLMISARAPFVGEVGRLEADRDSVLVVNKLRNCYCKESLAGISQMADMTLEDIQALLLGRLFIAGKGTLKASDVSAVDIYPQDPEDDSYLVLPANQADDALFTYGFTSLPDGRATLLMVSAGLLDTLLQLEYDYSEKNKTLLYGYYIRKNKEKSVSLELDKPKFGVKGFSPIKLDSGMKRMGIKEFARNLKF